MIHPTSGLVTDPCPLPQFLLSGSHVTCHHSWFHRFQVTRSQLLFGGSHEICPYFRIGGSHMTRQNGQMTLPHDVRETPIPT